MAVEFVDADSIRRIARDVFGADAVVTCVRKIGPSEVEGVTERPPSTRNLLYVVDIARRSRSFVFRFSTVEDDVYEKEARNYALLAERTAVRVPTIYRLDTSRRIVPTAYMVMDYLRGKRWSYAAHPDNRATDASDKASIGEAVGGLYARSHASTRDANQRTTEAQTILYTLDRLEIAVRRGNLDATPLKIDACRQAVLQESAFRAQTLSLCLADSEVHVRRGVDGWEIAFVCDVEWVEYRHPFSDLTQLLAGPRPWWKLTVPVASLDQADVAKRPFFKGYCRHRSVDFDELLRLGAYYQLGLWSYVAMTCRTADEQHWIRTEKAPLIHELIDHIAQRVKATSPVT